MRTLLSGQAWRVGGFIPSDWTFRRIAVNEHAEPAHGWVTATVPGHVQSDLIDAGVLPDPFIDRNSQLCEWTSARDWIYELRFEAEAGPARLCFGGVDYACEVFFNGEPLGTHEGMFGFSFDVTLTQSNRLVVAVKAAPPSQTEVGDTALVRNWKPRFAYWWDFSARLVPLGIWEDVWIETGATVGDVRVETADDHVVIEARPDAVVTIIDPSGEHIASGPPGRFDVADPQLWWPNGEGGQPLYTARVTVAGDTKDVRFGFRTLTVDNFDFVVNGRAMFIKGWNWVPVHQLYGRTHEQTYRHLIRRAKDAGCNLIRIWGGGLLERELFYDLCDEAGLLVWQDFIQSSSGLNSEPATDSAYLAYAAEQARHMVRARRNHPSLAVWCAGNELAVGAKRIPLTDDHPTAAALRAVVEADDRGRTWIVTTPTGAVPFAQPGVDGVNVHGTYLYLGDGEQETFYNSFTCVFQGEVGCEGAANVGTLTRTIITPWPQSDLWAHKGSWWQRYEFVEAAFGPTRDLEAFVKASQYLQAVGLRTIVEAAERRAPVQHGIILWQLNEPWPNSVCTSVIDVYGHPKPGYWAVAHAYRGFGAERAPAEWFDATTGLAVDGPIDGGVAIRTEGDNAYVVSSRDEYPFAPLLTAPASMQVVVDGAVLRVRAVGGPLHGVFVQTLTDHGGPYVSDGWRWFLRPGDEWVCSVEGSGALEISALNAEAVRVTL